MEGGAGGGCKDISFLKCYVCMAGWNQQGGGTGRRWEGGGGGDNFMFKTGPGRAKFGAGYGAHGPTMHWARPGSPGGALRRPGRRTATIGSRNRPRESTAPGQRAKGQ